MTKISRFKLSSEQIHQLNQRMISAVASLREKKALNLFFDDLLTMTEKIMLGKRLLIALLLERGYSYGAVSVLMKVSQGTIHAVSTRLQKGGTGFRLAIKNLEKEEKIEHTLEKVFVSFGKLAKPLTSKTSAGYYQRKQHN
ncbi:MAG: Trp family transcriptional regulator [Patescibacteria group bacterium]